MRIPESTGEWTFGWADARLPKARALGKEGTGTAELSQTSYDHTGRCAQTGQVEVPWQHPPIGALVAIGPLSPPLFAAKVENRFST
jgi:hypothetical protein